MAKPTITIGQGDDPVVLINDQPLPTVRIKNPGVHPALHQLYARPGHCLLTELLSVALRAHRRVHGSLRSQEVGDLNIEA